MSWLGKEFTRLGGQEYTFGLDTVTNERKNWSASPFFSPFRNSRMNGCLKDLRNSGGKKDRTVKAGMGDNEPLEFTVAGQIIKIS